MGIQRRGGMEEK